MATNTVEDGKKLQERLNDVQAKLKFLQMKKEENEKEKQAIDEALKQLGIKNGEQLEATIKAKEQELVTLKTKFDEALKKLEETTTVLENKVKGV
jgi:predicted nuclease with TOPRIM domain